MDYLRESIFASAFRAFCKSIAVILGIAVGVVCAEVAIVALTTSNNMLPPKSEPLLMPDAEGSRALLPSSAPVILRLDFHGEIGLRDLTSAKIEDLLLDSQEDLFKGGRVKAILLHMDTPGGSSTDTDTIYRALMAYKQKHNIPIYAYVDGLCASGGVYITSAADKIYSSHSSIIGSVGVRMGPNFNFAEAMTKYGVSALTLTEGKDKDALNPFRPWKPDEDASLKDVMAILYDQFVTIVSQARPKLTKELLVGTYGAHVFVAPEAEQLGYVDVGNASYSDAVQALASAAQIGEKEPYQVIQLQPSRSFWGDFAQSLFPSKMMRSFMGQEDILELNGKVLYYYRP
jgi:signal peptide peptidase SppA